MENVEPKIFLFLRLRCDGELIAKTKIREFRALGKLLADLTRSFLQGDIDRPEDPTETLFEYVDANSGEPLLSLRSTGSGLSVSGYFPPEYHPRMLDEEGQEDQFSMSDFVERASRGLDDERKEELAGMVSRSNTSLLAHIKRHIGDDGRFDFDLPITRPL